MALPFSLVELLSYILGVVVMAFEALVLIVMIKLAIYLRDLEREEPDLDLRLAQLDRLSQDRQFRRNWQSNIFGALAPWVMFCDVIIKSEIRNARRRTLRRMGIREKPTQANAPTAPPKPPNIPPSAPPAPPRFAQRCFFFVPKRQRDPCLGDLEERYYAVYQQSGYHHARRWYNKEAFTSLGCFVLSALLRWLQQWTGDFSRRVK